MTKGREKSDDCMVPEGHRKTAPIARTKRGGKAVTASKSAIQLELCRETADSPKGSYDRADIDLSTSARIAVPKSRDMNNTELPAMTMEQIANEENLKKAFSKVASNKGAPGPDRQTIQEVGRNLGEIIPALNKALLDGSYKPGNIRRVWIPKPGGKRGLG